MRWGKNRMVLTSIRASLPIRIAVLRSGSRSLAVVWSDIVRISIALAGFILSPFCFSVLGGAFTYEVAFFVRVSVVVIFYELDAGVLGVFRVRVDDG